MTTTVKTKTAGFVAPDGTRFGSKAEWNFWQHCEARQARGELRNLRRAIRLPLLINGVQVGVYTPDALYEELVSWDDSYPTMWEWQPRVVEVKGYVTREWPFRKKVIEACLGEPLLLVPASEWSDSAVARRAKQQAQPEFAL